MKFTDGEVGRQAPRARTTRQGEGGSNNKHGRQSVRAAGEQGRRRRSLSVVVPAEERAFCCFAFLLACPLHAVARVHHPPRIGMAGLRKCSYRSKGAPRDENKYGRPRQDAAASDNDMMMWLRVQGVCILLVRWNCRPSALHSRLEQSREHFTKVG